MIDRNSKKSRNLFGKSLCTSCYNSEINMSEDKDVLSKFMPTEEEKKRPLGFKKEISIET